MIDKQTEELASLYVLDLLDGETLAYFEARVAADPDLARFVYSLHETTAALSLASCPARPSASVPSFDSIQKQIRFIPQSPKPTASALPTRRKLSLPWRHLGPAAAAFLLAANLFFLYQNKHEPASQPDSSPNAVAPQILPSDSLQALNQQLQQIEAENRILAAENHQLTSLLNQYPELTALQLKRIYLNETSSISPQDPDFLDFRTRLKSLLENNPNLGRITIMELKGSNASDQEIAENTPPSDISKTIESFIALASTNSVFNRNESINTFTSTDPNTRPSTPSFSADASAPDPDNNINLGSWAGYPIQSNPDLPSSNLPTEPSPADLPSAPHDTTQIPPQPEALNFWDEGQQKGYIDIKNLQPSNQTYVLWARDIDSDQYINVGSIPASNNTDLSLSYTIPQDDFILAKIIVTLEPNPNPPSPGSNIVLQ